MISAGWFLGRLSPLQPFGLENVQYPILEGQKNHCQMSVYRTSSTLALSFCRVPYSLSSLKLHVMAMAF